MKVTHDVDKVETSDNFISKSFSIKATAKSFQVLSSNLYSNKIRAIIRELSTNAIDAHIAAKQKDAKYVERPYEVHLPQKLEPWFFIRDYGTGLSRDDVFNIYTVLFASTKEESNDFIGAMGLGSKTPFGYTKNFTVTSWHDGEKAVYAAFINSQGVPDMTEMARIPSSEPNGIEVRFSVENGADMTRFSDEARLVYQWFSVDNRPVINEGTFVFKELPLLNATDNATTKKLARYDVLRQDPYTSYYSSTSYAVMGNIGYPISLPGNWPNDLYDISTSGVVLYFDIGELDIAPSRETLSYDDTTVSNIIKHAYKVKEAITKEVNDVVASLKNKNVSRLEVIRRLVAMQNSRLYNKSAVDQIGKLVGTLMADTNKTGRIYDRTSIPRGVDISISDSDYKMLRAAAHKTTNRCGRTTFTSLLYNGSALNQLYIPLHEILNNSPVILNDLTEKAGKYRIENKGDCVYIDLVSGTDINAAIKMAKRIFMVDAVTLTSSLPASPKEAPKTRTAALPKPDIQVLERREIRKATDAEIEYFKDSTKPKICVPLAESSGFVKSNEIKEIMANAKSLCIELPPIYICKIDTIRDYKIDIVKYSIQNYYKNGYDAIIKDKKRVAELHRMAAIKHRPSMVSILQKIDGTKNLKPTTKLAKFIKKYKLNEPVKDDINLNDYALIPGTGDAIGVFEAEIDDLNRTYTLLPLARDNRHRLTKSDLDGIATYINAVKN